MNRKSIFAVILVLLAGALFFVLRRGGSSSYESDQENVPTLVTVQVGRLTRATLHSYVTGYGSVQPAPASAAGPAAFARVAAPIAGIVARVHVAEGAHVRRGDRLVDLDDRAAAVAVKYAAETAARQRQLYAQHNTSLKALQDAEAQFATARTQLAFLHVTAPLAGTITRLNARTGEAVDLTTVLAEITNLDRLVVSTAIPSEAATALREGQTVELLDGSPVTTKVEYVSPTVDPANDSVIVLAAVPPDAALRAGALVRVRITTGEHRNVLAAPANSVVTNEDGKDVISVVANNEATQVPVVTGFSDAGLVEIAGAGLVAGETVVTVGAYGLPAKTQVRVVQP